MSVDFAEVPIVVAEGGGLDEEWTLKDEDGTAIDITGDTFKAEVRDTYDTTGALRLTITPTISNATGGKIQFTVLETDATLSALANKTYHYDLFRKPSGAPAVKIAQGTFTKAAAATDY